MENFLSQRVELGREIFGEKEKVDVGKSGIARGADSASVNKQQYFAIAANQLFIESCEPTNERFIAYLTVLVVTIYTAVSWRSIFSSVRKANYGIINSSVSSRM